MTILWLPPQQISARWAIAAHNVTRAEYDIIIEHEVVIMSTVPDKHTRYTEIVLNSFCTQRWGVDYCADLLKQDVEDGEDAVELDQMWHDAISMYVRPIFEDEGTDTSTWQGGEHFDDSGDEDDGWRGDAA
jgi:hypothetical protein